MKKIRLVFIISAISAAATVCAGCDFGKTLLNIRVNKAPDTLTYSVGEIFDPTGMEIMATFSDESEQAVSDYRYSPTGELALTDKYVVISYKGKTCSQQITVLNEQRTQTGIEVTKAPEKTDYIVGETFDPTGMIVKKAYEDGTGATITDYTYSPSGELDETDTRITIKSGRFRTTTPISVTKPGEKLVSISIENGPNKTEYFEGESFNPNGMVVKANYENGTSQEIDNYTYSPQLLTLGTTSVTISYLGKTATVSITVKENKESGYYEGINPNSSTLLNDLNSLNSRKRKSTVGYKAMLNNPEKGFYVTDPGTGNKTITTFYSGKNNNGTTGLNREHVWPDSRGGNIVEADIHMPRPTLSKENGSRGNSFYVEGKCKPSGGWDPAMEDFGLESYRGDSARIIFYCAIASLQLKLVDKEDDNAGNKTMGKLSDLLRWNLEYPVLDRELTRNDGAESLQGNRNPFIDHPEYACKIWGTTNSETRRICGMN